MISYIYYHLYFYFYPLLLGSIYTVLNKQIVIILVARGLPKEFLLSLIEEEIKGTIIDTKDDNSGRKRAYKLVRSNTVAPISSIYDDDLDEEDEMEGTCPVLLCCIHCFPTTPALCSAPPGPFRVLCDFADAEVMCRSD